MRRAAMPVLLVAARAVVAGCDGYGFDADAPLVAVGTCVNYTDFGTDDYELQELECSWAHTHVLANDHARHHPRDDVGAEPERVFVDRPGRQPVGSLIECLGRTEDRSATDGPSTPSSAVSGIQADREPTIAFVLSAVLVTVAVVSVGVFTPATLFAAFLAWFGIAQIAMGVHDTLKSATTGGG